jgi:hypothetical protein
MQKMAKRCAPSLVGIAGISCTVAHFLICDDDDRSAIGVASTQERRQKVVCADSESHGLATKKFSWSQR